MSNSFCPDISVIIPVYNGEKYVLRAVESVLAQTHPSFEILVVDDGSTDNSSRVIDQYIQEGKVQCIRQSNQGLSEARNTGIRAARGRFIKFLDCDDTLYPRQLEKQFCDLKDEPRTVLSVSNFVMEFKDGRKKEIDIWLGDDNQLARFLAGMPCPVHTILVDRELVAKHNGFSKDLKCMEDADLWLRILIDGGKFKKTDYTGCTYYMLDESLSDDEERMFLSKVRYWENVNSILKERLDTLSIDTENELLKANYKLMQTARLRNKQINDILPVTVANSEAIYRKRSTGLKGNLKKLLGLKFIVYMNYIKNVLTDKTYKYMLLNSHAHWRKFESY